MANTFLTTDVIAREALMVLRNNAVMANLVHRDYSGEFVAGVGDTITIKKPAKFLRGVVYPLLTVIFGIPVLLINLIEKLTRYIQDLPRPLTYEEKLVQFMTERMKCTEVIKENNKEDKKDS